MPPLHVCLACLGCLFMLPLQKEAVLSPRNPQRHHAIGWALRRCGAGAWDYLFHLVPTVRGHWCTRPHCALNMAQYTVSQHHAIGLQTDCMVIVLAPVVRLLDSHMYSLWP